MSQRERETETETERDRDRQTDRDRDRQTEKETDTDTERDTRVATLAAADAFIDGNFRVRCTQNAPRRQLFHVALAM